VCLSDVRRAFRLRAIMSSGLPVTGNNPFYALLREICQRLAARLLGKPWKHRPRAERRTGCWVLMNHVLEIRIAAYPHWPDAASRMP
jgi:hypothetical protein